MVGANNEQIRLSNVDSPFTELFSLISKLELLLPSDGECEIQYQKAELQVISQHIDNAINAILVGMQEIGNLLAGNTIRDNNKLQGVAGMLAVLCNLIEALFGLQHNCAYILEQRGVV